MTEQNNSPVGLLRELLAQKSRRVAQSHNAAGYVAMWPEAVREVIAKFPNLSASEKSSLRGTVEDQIQRLSRVTNIDIHQFAAARGSVARILGGARC
jgi:hypothetical protein